MKSALLLLFGSFIALTLVGQTKNFTSFIPKDYDTLVDGVVRGDLNKDGKEDIAMALRHNWETKENANEQDEEKRPKRLLIILFGSASGYQQNAKSSKAILCKGCGGMLGDPFQGMAINNGVLTINHYGGSAWRWSYTHKFRFQENDWFLIGKTTLSYWNVKQCEKLDDFAGTDYEDINFVTGQYEKKKISEDCKLLVNKKGKRKTAPLVSLTKFSIDN